MRRRDILALVGGAVAWPLTVRAQTPARVWRVGLVETTPIELNAANLAAFRGGLRALGYVEGQNLVIEYRFITEGGVERFRPLVSELIGLDVDVLVTRGTPATLAAKQATAIVPIVMAAIAEPVAVGAVTNLSRPEANITGLSAFLVELAPKHLELLSELIPGIARVAIVSNAGSRGGAARWKKAEAAGAALSITPQLLDVRRKQDIAWAFDIALRGHAQAVAINLDQVIRSNLGLVIELAAQHRLPAIYPSREFIEAGGLISYGPRYQDLYLRAASFVDKIFKGAKPSDLPVEQPTTVEMLVNLKTARALGLAVPISILLRADEVIE
jgi:putative ABC transport system substrate-binding protein